MKPLLINLCVLLIALAVYFWMPRRQPAQTPLPRPEAAEVQVQLVQPLEVTAPIAEPLFQPLEPQLGAVPIAELEPQRPVQTLEERGDAMLFEADALGGTPFDKAVVMPFESP